MSFGSKLGRAFKAAVHDLRDRAGRKTLSAAAATGITGGVVLAVGGTAALTAAAVPLVAGALIGAFGTRAVRKGIEAFRKPDAPAPATPPSP